MKLFLSAVLAGLTASAALAADLPSRATPPAYVPPTFVWTGFYLGANAGAAVDGGATSAITGNNAGLQANTVDGLRPNHGHQFSDGFTGGGQIGYNYQLDPKLFGNSLFGGSALVGVEADAAYTGLHHDSRYFSIVESDFGERTDFVGTVRGRVGYAFGNILVYGTGGFAYGGADNTSSFLNPAGTQIYYGRNSTIRTGYAYGGGVEVAVPTLAFANAFQAGAVTIKAEFIRYELGPTSYVIGNIAGIDPGYTQRVRNSGDLVRAGINYKLDLFGAPPPVVARY